MNSLTNRQRQILALIAQGLSNKEIGRLLDIKPTTVKVHLHEMYLRLRVGNRTKLAVLSINEEKIA
jgi:two-component system nitrate/nitrite response regulator NarL